MEKNKILLYAISFSVILFANITSCDDQNKSSCTSVRNNNTILTETLSYNDLFEDGVLDIAVGSSLYESADEYDEQDYGYIQEEIEDFLSSENHTLDDYCINLHYVQDSQELGLSLEQYDMVIYKGHSRFGLGPAIKSVADYFLVKDINLFSIDFFEIIISYLLYGFPDGEDVSFHNYLRNIDVKAKIVAFISCDSNTYFKESFNSMAPQTLFIGMDGVIDGDVDHVIHFIKGLILHLPLERIMTGLENGFLMQLDQNNMWQLYQVGN